MGDFAGVDPQRIRMLADRLDELARALEQHAPKIRRLFNEWNGTINQSVLFQQAAQVRTDAHDMARRADLALSLTHETRFVDPSDPHKNWSFIPWDISKIDDNQEAQAEAIDLKQAMDDPENPQSREIIKEVAQSLADHADDPSYLQAFMANGGIDQAIRAARVLHEQDGTHGGAVLSADSQRILAQFSRGLQAATTLAAGGRIELPPDYLHKLTNPPGGDMWSVGMLFAYGPRGNQWDPNVLSSVGGAMLDWRAAHEMRPDYSPPSVDSMGAGGYVENHGDFWYESLGLSVDYTKGNKGTDQKITAIDANDPSIVLMQRVGENADASRAMLTGPDGARHARELVSYTWQTPGPLSFDDAKWPATVIAAATLDRTAHPQASAQAAANIVNAGAAEYGTEVGRDDYEREQYRSMPSDLTRALTQVFAAYVPDFAYSTDGRSDSKASVIQPQDNGTFMLHIGRDTMKDFLSEVMQSHSDGTNVVNAVNAQVALTFAKDSSSPQSRAYLSDLAELRGEASVAGQRVNYDAAARTDADNADDIKWLNVVGGFVASVPTNNVPADFVKAAIWGALPIASAAFSTDHAATVDDDAQVTVFDDYSQMRVSIVQGLVASGRIQPPHNHPEWANGAITFRPGSRDQQDFEGWWTGIAQSHPEIENIYKTEMGNGFDLGAGRFTSH